MKARDAKTDARHANRLHESSEMITGARDQSSGAIIDDRITLRKFFRQSEFRQTDRLNEYDEKYTFFTPRGALITREMRRAWGKLDETMLADNKIADEQLMGNEHAIDPKQV